MTNLDHGETFMNQTFHELLTLAEDARIFGKDSIEYMAIISRLANMTLGHRQVGGKFVRTELEHYDKFHGQTMQDIKSWIEQTVGPIPFRQYFQGYNFTNITPDKGNAEGGPFEGGTPDNLPPARIFREAQIEDDDKAKMMARLGIQMSKPMSTNLLEIGKKK